MKTLFACKWYVLSVPVIILLFYTCKKSYSPPVISSANSYLVVEGNIDGGDSTIITLSRTVPLNSKSTSKPEMGASVQVEDNAGGVFPLTSDTAGVYYIPSLALDATKTYRLRITTSDKNVYLSDFLPVKNSPPIDSIGYTIEANGLQVYVNTHDPKNNTTYYQWDYSEAWRFHAEYVSNWQTDGTEIVLRPFSQQIYSCYTQSKSTEVVLASSAKLTQDVIYQAPVQFVSSTSEKLESRYSIQIRQHALTADAYNFWTQLKKNTENLGTIFDAQPSELTGNIHNTTNPSNAVLGYISCGNVQTKRIYINASALPAWSPTYPFQCELDSTYFVNPKTLNMDVAEYLIPLPAIYYLPTDQMFVNGALKGYFRTTLNCADCTVRGNVSPPAFWQDN